MKPMTRRRFVQGTAGAAGMLSVAGSLRFLEQAPAAEAGDVAGKEVYFRTGHSNNCDGACGHLMTVVDGKVRLIQGAPWGQKTIAGKPAPEFHPRTCLRGTAQIQNTYSPDRLKYPYQRVGERGSGQWRRISWDDATSLIAENFERVQRRYGKKSVWIAPYTGSLALLEGVVGAGYRFASVTGASAGDFEGDNEGDSSSRASCTTPPTSSSTRWRRSWSTRARSCSRVAGVPTLWSTRRMGRSSRSSTRRTPTSTVSTTAPNRR
jgi:anaerobic selenocysteine-containing dehydrogenase